MSPTLSVVMPVYNEALHVGATIDALVAAVDRAGFEAELVVVDDGSTDGTARVASEACAGRLPLRVVSQPNRGRLEARRGGLEASTGDFVLLLDGRVTLDPGGLEFVVARIARGEEVWNGHVDVAADRNPYGVFWRLLAELAWRDYFARPRTTAFDSSNFDRFPKGTTCFLAPRGLLLEATNAFRSRYAEPRFANDDTPLIRWIAERGPIHISPRFSCLYVPRTRLQPFIRHSFRRGIVFLDGHGRRESRFFWAAVGFYPGSVLLALAAIRRPALVPIVAAAVSAGAASLALKRKRTAYEIVALATLAPVYAVAHGAGMWRGLGLLLRARSRSGATGPPRRRS